MPPVPPFCFGPSKSAFWVLQEDEEDCPCSRRPRAISTDLFSTTNIVTRSLEQVNRLSYGQYGTNLGLVDPRHVTRRVSRPSRRKKLCPTPPRRGIQPRPNPCTSLLPSLASFHQARLPFGSSCDGRKHGWPCRDPSFEARRCVWESSVFLRGESPAGSWRRLEAVREIAGLVAAFQRVGALPREPRDRTARRARVVNARAHSGPGRKFATRSRASRWR